MCYLNHVCNVSRYIRQVNSFNTKEKYKFNVGRESILTFINDLIVKAWTCFITRNKDIDHIILSANIFIDYKRLDISLNLYRNSDVFEIIMTLFICIFILFQLSVNVINKFNLILFHY